MPCTVTDKDYYTISNAQPPPNPKVDPDPLYYRPFHMLSGYRTKAEAWLEDFNPQDLSAHRTEIPIDFETARPLDWAVFGHEGLVQSPVPNPADNLYSSISAKISFIGLQAFDVDRGLWDVKQPRNLQLGPNAPQSLLKPFFKTTKLLLGYGVDLTITLPVAVTAADILNQQKVISLLGVPITQRNIQGNQLHISLGDNAYPVLLGVLAQEI